MHNDLKKRFIPEKDVLPAQTPAANEGTGGDAAALMKLLTNPETASLLRALVNAMGSEGNK